MQKPRTLRKSFSSYFHPKNKIVPIQNGFFRREALRLSPIIQIQTEAEEDIPLEKKDSFEKSLDNTIDETSVIRKQLYENMKMLFNYKESKQRKPFIFARDDDDNSSVEDKEEDKLGYVEYYERKYEEFHRENDTVDNLYTMKKEPFELLRYYGDPYICLDFRKRLLFVKYFISYISIKITHQKWFDYFMLVIILFNCIILAMDTQTTEDQTMSDMDVAFIVIYTVEMMLKMWANGLFFDKYSYFRGGWNLLDFTIVVTSYIPYVFSYQVKSFNISSLRTLRVLRPLRTITSIKSLKILMATLFSSIPLLMDTITVLLLFFNIFSISGLQMFSGVLKQCCFNLETGIKLEGTDGEDLLCGYDQCPEGGICGKIIDNPRWGVINFDNYFYSLLMVFQCVNLQGWSYIMLCLIETYTIYVAIYFIILIFIGSFFLLNLTLAVIKAKFTDNASKRTEQSNKDPISKPEDQVDINELKVIKRLERTHYNRLKKRGTAIINNNAEIFKKRISIKTHGLTENEVMGLSQRILEQKFKEKIVIIKSDKKIHKLPSKGFPLSELIMKRMLKNNKKMIKDLFKIKQKPPDNYESIPGTVTIKPQNIQKSLKFIGLQHIYKERLLKRSMSKDSHGNNNRGLKGLISLRSKQFLHEPEDDFLDEIQKEIPKDIQVKPEITLKSLKVSSSNSTKQTIESPRVPYFLENDEDLVKNNLFEIAEDPEIFNIFNDGMFKHYYQETGAMAPILPALKLVTNFSLEVRNDGKFKEFWLKSPEAAKQTALDKFLKNPSADTEVMFHTAQLGNKSIVLTKKLSMVSPDKTSQIDYLRNDKTGALANFSHLFNQKKRMNLRNYKIMVDFNKPFRSISQDDVLENRAQYLIMKKKQQELKNFKAGKYIMIYHQRKKLKNPIKLNKQKTVIDQMLLRRVKTMSFREMTNKITTTKEEVIGEMIVGSNIYSSSPLKSSPGKSPRSKKKHLMYSANKRPSDAIVMSYDNVKRLMKEKMTHEQKPLRRENEELYFTIIKKDLKEKTKSVNHWSGEEVLNNPMNFFSKFNSIFKALSTKNQDKKIWLPGFKGQMLLSHKLIKNFICSKFVENFMLLLVIFNTVILTLDSIFTDPDTLDLFQNFNLFFTIVFASEMLLKIIAFSLVGYLQDKTNLFDAIVVVISMIEIIFIESQDSATLKTLQTLKAFRVLRVMRLLRSLKFMNMIVNVLSKTLASFIYIAILLIIFILIYALLGMKLFGGEFDFPDKVYRQNFDNYGQAFLSVFQILSRSYWYYFLYLMFRSQINNFISAFYLISWIFVGNFVLLNLFLAIILDGFNQAVVENEEDLPNDYICDEIEPPNNAVVEMKQPPVKYKSISPFDPLKNSEIERLFESLACENSFYLFNKSYPLRIFCFRLTKSHKFENFTLLLIILNTAKMILDTYIDPAEYSSSGILDEILTFAFLVETLIKSVAMGFVIDKGSYLRDTWNVWDFIIVVTSLVDVFTTGFTVSVIKVFRLLRTLRPLRFVSHNVNMKIVVNSLLDSVTSIINVFIVILTVWLMFALLGISLLGGRMGHCDIEEFYGVSKEMCLQMGQEWVIYDTNFDNIYYAMNSLFIIGSLEGWPDIMYYCIDSNTADIGPIQDNYSFISIYFIFFILIGAFFLMNLFIGVMFFHFNLAQKHEKSKKNLFLTEDQSKWLDIQKMIVNARPDFKYNRRPDTRVQKYIDNIITSKLYEYLLTFLYVLTILILSMSYESSPLSYKETLENLNFSIIVLILLDFLLRLISYGPSYYIYTNWARLDLFITTCSLIDFLSILSLLKISSEIRQLMRITRVLFLLKLIKRFKGINNLIGTLMFSLPSLLNVGALLILIYLMYSILGVYLFQNISQGVVIDEYNNFHNFHLAMLLLFKCSTGDEWFLVMFDLSDKNPGCETDDSCGSIYAIPYFLSFFLICSYIMLNLFILIIIQQFEEYHLRVNNPIQTFRENLETFKKIWSEFSLASEGLNISHRNLIEFYMKLPEPLGFHPGISRAVIAKEIMNMNLSGDADGNIYFNELLFSSMRRVFGAEVLKNAQSEIQMLLKREEYAIRKKIEKFKKKDIRKYSIISSRVSSKKTSRTSSFFSSFFEKPIPEEFGFRKNIVNPIMEFFFVGMAFKSWKKFTNLKLEKQLANDDSLIVAEDDVSNDEEIEEEEEENESESEEEDDEASPVEGVRKMPYFQSKYLNRNRAKSILVRGEENENKLGEMNFMMNLKRRVSNLFMIKPLNVVHPE